MKLCKKFGWAGRTRTYEMPESKSSALPLGYSPIKKIGWDGRTQTNEMPESESGALPTWRHPNPLLGFNLSEYINIYTELLKEWGG